MQTSDIPASSRSDTRRVFAPQLAGLALVACAIGCTTAQAATMGPVYPPPGGVTFSGAGSAGGPGGRTNSYSAFDVTGLSGLYWGADSSNLPAAGLNGTLSPMTFVGVSGNQATWSVASSWFNPTTTVTSLETILLTISIAGLGANPWIDATTVGLASSIGWIVDNSLGQNFSANLAFTVPTEFGLALNSLQQLTSCGGNPCARSSFAGAFYYINAVPEPGTLALAGLGLLGIGFIRRRSGQAAVDEPAHTTQTA
jgi:hypothetical protein